MTLGIGVIVKVKLLTVSATFRVENLKLKLV
jgi:hypothetical protein